LYEGTKDPARKPRISVWQARKAIMIATQYSGITTTMPATTRVDAR